MNTNDPAEMGNRIFHVLERIESEQKALREGLDRNMQALREEFHRDRRFSAMIFMTTQIAIIGALLRLAGLF